MAESEAKLPLWKEISSHENRLKILVDIVLYSNMKLNVSLLLKENEPFFHINRYRIIDNVIEPEQLVLILYFEETIQKLVYFREILNLGHVIKKSTL